MIQKNKGKLILSSVVILMPILAGLLLWDKLPQQMTIHWGGDGNADGWSSRVVAVFALPLILLAIHWLCVLITAYDHKNREQSQKVFGMVLWILPVISFFACGITYATALGKEFQNDTLALAFLGLVFVIVGNYLPKCRQNYTVGIKVKWALASEENWNATHRLAGKIWVVGGLLMMTCIFLPERMIPTVPVVLLAAIVLLPTVYSWWYYKRQAKAGQAPEKAVVPLPGWSRGVRAAALAFTAVILVFVAVMCFTGNIQVEYGADSFTIRASYWEDLTVPYDAIVSLEYREEFTPGVRTSGFGSPRLSMGSFHNSELGDYTLYAYTQCDACVVLMVNGKILAVSGKDAESTAAIYQELLQRQ